MVSVYWRQCSCYYFDKEGVSRPLHALWTFRFRHVPFDVRDHRRLWLVGLRAPHLSSWSVPVRSISSAANCRAHL
jgi:hypothetical protein